MIHPLTHHFALEPVHENMEPTKDVTKVLVLDDSDDDLDCNVKHYPFVGKYKMFRVHPEGCGNDENVIYVLVKSLDKDTLMLMFVKDEMELIPIPEGISVQSLTKKEDPVPVNGIYYLLPRSDKYNVKSGNCPYPLLSLKSGKIYTEAHFIASYQRFTDRQQGYY